MADDQLRDLERRWRETNASEDEAAWVRARLRAGEHLPTLLDLSLHDSVIDWICFDAAIARLEFALNLCAEDQPGFLPGSSETLAGSLVLLGVAGLEFSGPSASILQPGVWQRGCAGSFLSASLSEDRWELCFEVGVATRPEQTFCILDLAFVFSYFEANSA